MKSEVPMKKSMDQVLQETFFQNRENEFSHSTYDEEMLQYTYLKNGDYRAVPEGRKMFENAAEGILSKDVLRNWKYMFVASTTLCCRFAMDGGLDSETSYNISDLYIQRADTAMTKEEIFQIHDEMVKDYLKKIKALHNKNVYSRPVLRAIDYIDGHLQRKIVLDDISENADVTPTYLSALFAKEMGITISHYIRKRRIEAASAILKYYDYSITEIAEYFNFSSVSHFIKVFREQTGTTPSQYRADEFRKWKNESVNNLNKTK